MRWKRRLSWRWGSRRLAEPVDLTISIERAERHGPVAFQRGSYGEDATFLATIETMPCSSVSALSASIIGVGSSSYITTPWQSTASNRSPSSIAGDGSTMVTWYPRRASGRL